MTYVLEKVNFCVHLKATKGSTVATTLVAKWLFYTPSKPTHSTIRVPSAIRSFMIRGTN